MSSKLFRGEATYYGEGYGGPGMDPGHFFSEN